jgi:hypothetical protein
MMKMQNQRRRYHQRLLSTITTYCARTTATAAIILAGVVVRHRCFLELMLMECFRTSRTCATT